MQQILFTPGPLLTSKTVKEACLLDMGSRDPKFISIIKEIRAKLLELGHVNPEKYAAILLQGSGTYGVEATLQSAIRREGDKVLLLSNGSYGERQAKIMDACGRKYVKLQYEENVKVKVQDIIDYVTKDQEITHISLIHSETTSGIINDIDFKKQLPRPITLIVDAVSSFGVYDIPIEEYGIDFLISTSNKNIQGIPGFAFIIANLEKLKPGVANSLVLDLYDQEDNMRKTSQFRYTPPTHALRAFLQALKEHHEEGGVLGRQKRYRMLQQYLSQTMRQMGFKLFVQEEDQGCIITTFLMPQDERFVFQDFYDYLSERNLVIYPGKMTKVNTFRIGSIGDLKMENMEELMRCIKEYFEVKQYKI